MPLGASNETKKDAAHRGAGPAGRISCSSLRVSCWPSSAPAYLPPSKRALSHCQIRNTQKTLEDRAGCVVCSCLW